MLSAFVYKSSSLAKNTLRTIFDRETPGSRNWPWLPPQSALQANYMSGGGTLARLSVSRSADLVTSQTRKRYGHGADSSGQGSAGAAGRQSAQGLHQLIPQRLRPGKRRRHARVLPGFHPGHQAIPCPIQRQLGLQLPQNRCDHISHARSLGSKTSTWQYYLV